MRRRGVVIGSGPNGLVAAVVLARAGLDVEVFEASAAIGGGTRTEELTLPGFRHDACSAIHPLARVSPAFRDIGLELDWIESPAACAHPFDDGTAVTLEREVDATAAQLGADACAYRALLEPVVRGARQFEGRRFPRGALPRVLTSLQSARAVAESAFVGEPARGFFAGHAAHSVLPLERRPSAGFGLVLGALGHAVGWPFPRGGSQAIADALAARLGELGGVVHASSPVDELPRADVVLADVMPRELLRLGRFPARYASALRGYRHGPGAFKLDWALDEPIPWTAEVCRRAATVHLGATFDEIAASERANRSSRPFVLLAQPSLFDTSRAPAGKHTAWAYCHVPNGSADDRADAIEAQVERFAPGFRGVIAARSARGPAELERDNRNYVGGDIGGGMMDLRQLLFRPVRRAVPYRTPLPGVYLCSSATPPGGGVHGLCGWLAAKVALRDVAKGQTLRV
ncbi:MAG: NAD(P)/FAD-dependent oxidoreductase [Actinobacteria bacterium]|nr:MAG: NAD(P)/FAD-dependent oxidoreductase [Actinomycetota bacterium]